jgi:hypothetical protein
MTASAAGNNSAELAVNAADFETRKLNYILGETPTFVKEST